MVRSDWRGLVLVCKKCTRKLGGRFRAKRRTPLTEALRRWSGAKKGRKAPFGGCEVDCLKLCHKGAVTVIDAGAARRMADRRCRHRGRRCGGAARDRPAGAGAAGDQPA